MFGLNKLQPVLVFGHAKDKKKVKPDEIFKFLPNQNGTQINIKNELTLTKQKNSFQKTNILTNVHLFNKINKIMRNKQVNKKITIQYEN